MSDELPAGKILLPPDMKLSDLKIAPGFKIPHGTKMPYPGAFPGDPLGLWENPTLSPFDGITDASQIAARYEWHEHLRDLAVRASN